jgi:hypothetical protein
MSENSHVQCHASILTRYNSMCAFDEKPIYFMSCVKKAKFGAKRTLHETFLYLYYFFFNIGHIKTWFPRNLVCARTQNI